MNSTTRHTATNHHDNDDLLHQLSLLLSSSCSTFFDLNDDMNMVTPSFPDHNDDNDTHPSSLLLHQIRRLVLDALTDKNNVTAIYDNSTATNYTSSNYSTSSYNDKSSHSSSSYSSSSSYGSSSYSSSYATRIDYSVLSVGIMTLGLIMAVELLRHKLDHIALGKPFLTAVLETVYTELATLGFVEFLVHLVTEYHDTYDKYKKIVFADVHFLLFYATIINAFQSCLLNYISQSISDRMWIQSEMLELNHYIEIREEFDIVSKQLYDMKHKKKKSSSNQQQNDINIKNSVNILRSITIEDVFEFDRRSIMNTVDAIYDQIRYPRLKRKYNQLLVQVRFHEIRISFLKAYKMPLKLKISDYLKRCELSVFLHLIHVSPVAWILLTGAVNLLYYVLGMITYESENTSIVGITFIYIFYSIIVLFVMVAWLLRRKMKVIFRSMMNDRDLWEVNEFTTIEEKERLYHNQMNMFWFKNPILVISLIQLMQFGYAIELSSFIVFFEEINDGPVPMSSYVTALIIGYAVFLWMIGNVVPKYTMCTSLAQLVNMTFLHQTLASYHLHELEQQMKQEVTLRDDDDDDHHHYHEMKGGELFSESDVVPASQRTAAPAVPVEENRRLHSVAGKVERLLNSFPESADLTPSNSTEYNDDKIFTHQWTNTLTKTEPLQKLSKLVEADSSEFDVQGWINTHRDGPVLGKKTKPTSFETIAEDCVVSEPSDCTRRRSTRLKSISDGVAFMAHVSDENFSSVSMNDNDTDVKGSASNFSSEFNFSHWLSANRVTPGITNRNTDSDNDDDKVPDQLPGPFDSRKTNQPRRERMKSLSDGVALMADLNNQFADNNINVQNTSRNCQPLHATGGSTVHRLYGETASYLHEGKHSSGVSALIDSPDLMTQLVGKKDINELRSILPNHLSSKHPSKKAASNHQDHITNSSGDSRRLVVKALSEQNLLETVSSTKEVRRTKSDDNLLLNTIVNDDRTAASALGSIDKTNETKKAGPNEVQNKKGGNDKLTSAEAYCSEAGDIPLRHESIATNFTGKHHHTTISIKERLRRYFCSKMYPLISHILGTTVAFFLVAKRVDIFLHEENIVPSYFVSFNLSPEFTFWSLAGSIICFILVSILIFYSVLPFETSVYCPEQKVFVAALIDIALAGMCLTLLVVAECRRCCHPNETSQETYAAYDGENEPENVCSCPKFGTRLYGGLGTIEPYTSLVALRVFRPYIAKRILVLMHGSYMSDTEKKNQISGKKISPFAVFDDHHGGHGDDHGHGNESRAIGTAAELWEAAIVNHPELIIQYGELSGEVLRCMLGIPVIGTHPKEAEPESPSKRSLQSLRQLSARYNGNDSLNAIELGKGADPRSDERKLSISSELTSPNARLIRSLRRCDRKLLPLIDKWTVVDVAITRSEMVYFDAVGVDNDSHQSHPSKDVVVAAKGGKHLRLSDVAEDRVIIGRLELNEIKSVYVERYYPGAYVPSKDEGPDINVEQTEFWKPSTTGDHFQNRSEHWETMKQDILCITTNHGPTIRLRFYADLEEAFHHPDRLAEEDEMYGSIFLNNALQWAQTLGRLCGPDQLLSQTLPHFGDGNSDELRDYIVLRKKKPDAFHRRNRMVSVASSVIAAERLHHKDKGISKLELQRSNTGSAERRSLSRPSFGRSQTVGGYVDGSATMAEDGGSHGFALNRKLFRVKSLGAADQSPEMTIVLEKVDL